MIVYGELERNGKKQLLTFSGYYPSNSMK